ncbi:MAG TPA: MMPL family transporter, partial [Myxococcota bacterium]|nr:MMPL family transporter [Myxococcota bacterium]
MIAAYARWISVRARAWAIVALTLLWAAVSGALSLSVEQDDDVLKFLPQSNPDIRAFYEINEAFGSTDVAIVGVRASDVFNADFLGRLRAATSEIKGTPGVDHVLSLTNVADFQKDTVNGGIVSGNLITDLPTDVASSQALREKVMSRDHVVGNLVSAQGDAVVLYAWVGPNESPREVAGRVRAAVERHFPSDDKVWGGGPFISDFIYTATQHDMARLTPWSIITILIIVLLAFRDLLGTVLGLVATGIGITTARALMVIAGVPFNIVLSSMPVILFAAGSAYAIHMLSRYYAHAERLGPGAAAVEAALVGTTRNVVTAGLTTVAGLWSFLLMDIEPMRVFGLFTGIGLIAALLMSLTLVPAVMVLFPRPARASLGKEISARTRELAVLARERRSLSLALMGGVVIVGAVFAGRVDTRMDLSAFFRPDSEPAQSQAFLEERFGGSQFIQIRVQGDLEDPLVLREVARVADRLQVIPHVSGVQGVHEAMEIINDAMSGARRVPDTSGQAGVLYRFLSSDPAVQRLITDARDQALLVVKIDVNDADTIDAVLAAVEGEIERGAMHTIAASPASGDPSRASIAGLVTARLGALAERFGVALP